jgi:hypothetical protein
MRSADSATYMGTDRGEVQVPILERSADKHWGALAAYQAYKQRVPVFVPRMW